VSCLQSTDCISGFICDTSVTPPQCMQAVADEEAAGGCGCRSIGQRPGAGYVSVLALSLLLGLHRLRRRARPIEVGRSV
jgi:MYXO-CTERM domain-containing protein